MARPKGIPAWNRKDLTGRQFGRLTVTEQAPSRMISGSLVGYWRCRCACGIESEIPTNNLTSGNTKSCGCLNRDTRTGNTYGLTHGHNAYNSPTYISWQGMLKRVRDDRPRYGGRGITVDPRWESFENFLTDMGERPEGTTLDRIDNDGPYNPSNCRWADGITQGNNRHNNRWVTHDGRTQTVAQWAREVGLTRQILHNRIIEYGWPIKKALFTPPLRRKR